MYTLLAVGHSLSLGTQVFIWIVRAALVLIPIGLLNTRKDTPKEDRPTVLRIVVVTIAYLLALLSTFFLNEDDFSTWAREIILLIVLIVVSSHKKEKDDDHGGHGAHGAAHPATHHPGGAQTHTP